jgi:hypothetical protein
MEENQYWGEQFWMSDQGASVDFKANGCSASRSFYAGLSKYKYESVKLLEN